MGYLESLAEPVCSLFVVLFPVILQYSADLTDLRLLLLLSTMSFLCRCTVFSYLAYSANPPPFVLPEKVRISEEEKGECAVGNVLLFLLLFLHGFASGFARTPNCFGGISQLYIVLEECNCFGGVCNCGVFWRST